MSERKIRDWAWPYIRNFRTYIDIGANDGDTSVNFINDFKKVIAFEPNPTTFDILSTNKLIESYNLALGSCNGKINLVVPFENKPQWGSTSTLRNANWSSGISYEVEIRTLDSFQFKEIDFIKVDVEQAELDVILGSKETIKQNLPVIMFENKRNEADDVIDILKEIGYTIDKHKSDTIAYIKE
jgi:FkbM family methyltransferase